MTLPPFYIHHCLIRCAIFTHESQPHKTVFTSHRVEAAWTAFPLMTVTAPTACTWACVWLFFSSCGVLTCGWEVAVGRWGTETFLQHQWCLIKDVLLIYNFSGADVLEEFLYTTATRFCPPARVVGVVNFPGQTLWEPAAQALSVK